MVTRLASHLPHPRVPFVPPPRRGVGEVGDEALDLRVQDPQLFLVTVQGVEQLTIDVELRLRPRPVADANRP